MVEWPPTEDMLENEIERAKQLLIENGYDVRPA